MKAIGVGIYLAPGDGPIGLAEPEAAERKADGRELFFREFQEIPGYACSLCTIGKPDYVSFSIKDMDTVLRALSREV